MELQDLGAANRVRQQEWMGDDWMTRLPLTFRTNEMAGECGEVAELLLDRWKPSERFGKQWSDALGEEMSDVVICADLVALALGEPLDLIRPEGLAAGAGNDYMWCARVQRDMGLLCNAAKKMDRTEYGIAGGIQYSIGQPVVMAALHTVVKHIYNLAYSENVLMPIAIARKFNKTSAKVGLKTLFIPPGYDRALLIP